MRFFIFVSFLLFTIVYSATAQNFQPFKNKYRYQFSYTGSIANQINSSLIHGIEVDSAALVGLDSIFYFNKLIMRSKDNFWGNSMVKKSGGDYLFLISNNTQNDTLIIKMQETLGAQWTFNLKNVLYTIQYTTNAQETVLTNQTDFVKTFIVENTSGFKDSIKLSENYGLIYSFPFSDDFFPQHHNFYLTYIFNSKLGENKINYFEYFNYDRGDVLVYSPITSGPSYGPPDRTDDNVYKVLSKTISSQRDTVTYSLSNCHIDAINSGVYSTTQTHCELVVTAYSVKGAFPYIDILSFPPNQTRDFFSFAPDMYNIKGMLIIEFPMVFEGFPTYTFKIGLGFEKYYFNGLPNYNDVTYENIKYIKQSNTNDDCSGLEKTLATTSNHISNGNILIAPNPFDNSLLLNTSNLGVGNWNLRIISALGVSVYTSEIMISSANQQIDLSNLTDLTAGIYFLSFENESQVYSQKIVKK
jgi:hypothetical protein